MTNVINFPKQKKVRDKEYNSLLAKATVTQAIMNNFIKENENSTQSLFSGMSDTLNVKHPKEVRDCFLSFYNAPSAETWALIRDKLLDFNTSSWQIWGKYDPNAPRSLSSKEDEEKYPDPNDFIKYYERHKKDRIEEYNKKLEEIQNKLSEYE